MSQQPQIGRLLTKTGLYASMSTIAIFQQLSSERRTAAATSRSLLALPDTLRPAAVTDEQLVYRCSAVLA
jgi:hypothetical protein